MKHKFSTSTPVLAAIDPSHWVDKYADQLFAYALNRLNDADLCRDLVQATFLAALERLDEFRGQSSERTWLTAILRFKVIEIYRKRSTSLLPNQAAHDRERGYFEPDNGHWKEDWAPQPFHIDTADPTLRKELAAILQKCMDRLPVLWYSIFSMKHMDEMRTEVICKELKVSTANFWVIMHRAKVNLRACLQKEGV